MKVETFLNFIEKAQVPEQAKQALSNREFIDKNPIFYLYYPKLFSNAFLLEKNEHIDSLCIAGYLYYHSIIYLDSILDEIKRVDRLPIVLTCQAESIKLLTDIFGKESVFWTYWNKRNEEYIKAIGIEKKLSEKKAVKNKDYYQLADYKAAFGKVAIDALYVLSGEKDPNTYSKLIESHKCFSIAYQIHDDIKDFKADYINKQFNWAYYQLMKNHGLEEDNIEILNKQLYLKGVATHLFKKAIGMCNEAIKKLLSINAPLWKDVLIENKIAFEKPAVEIDNYIKSIVARVASYLIGFSTVEVPEELLLLSLF